MMDQGTLTVIARMQELNKPAKLKEINDGCGYEGVGGFAESALENTRRHIKDLEKIGAVVRPKPTLYALADRPKLPPIETKRLYYYGWDDISKYDTNTPEGLAAWRATKHVTGEGPLIATRGFVHLGHVIAHAGFGLHNVGALAINAEGTVLSDESSIGMMFITYWSQPKHKMTPAEKMEFVSNTAKRYGWTATIVSGACPVCGHILRQGYNEHCGTLKYLHDSEMPRLSVRVNMPVDLNAPIESERGLLTVFTKFDSLIGSLR